MKLAILSDLHLGHSNRVETENDSFDNAEEAMEKSAEADLLIIAGDIFDVRMPKTGAWAAALRILTRPLLRKNSGVRLVSFDKKLKEISRRTLTHQPVLAIPGNHERRSEREQNAVQALENAGILLHLNRNTIVFEKEGERIAIHGMSSVPERYAKGKLQEWGPQPVEGCVNILVLHQSVDPYVYSPLEPPSLKLDELPQGFDVIINGHIHMQTIEKIGNTTFIIPGSTVMTSLDRTEAETRKGLVKIETGGGVRVEFVPLEKNRPFFYEEINLLSGQTLRDQVEAKINNLLFKKEFPKTPVIKLRLTGKENDIIEQDLRELERKYYGRALLVFSKELESEEMEKKIEFLRNLIEQRKSVEDIGLDLLRKNLEELKFASLFEPENIFYLLGEGEIDRVSSLLLGEQKTLTGYPGEKG